MADVLWRQRSGLKSVLDCWLIGPAPLLCLSLPHSISLLLCPFLFVCGSESVFVCASICLSVSVRLSVSVYVCVCVYVSENDCVCLYLSFSLSLQLPSHSQGWLTSETWDADGVEASINDAELERGRD